MPEARLYSAPNHGSVASSLTDTNNIISNGNHLTGAPDTQSQTISLFYPYTRKTHVKSAPIMGLSESKLSETKINSLFDLYKDENEDTILAEGIEQLCNDLQVSPEEFKVLILAWKLNAEQMCRFTREEFICGLKAMGVDSIKGIQQRLPEIVKEVKNDAELFKDLYRFTFKFGLDSPSRTLSTDMAISLWKLVFTVSEPPILQRWLDFLESHKNAIKGIPRDTWYMFLNFSESVGEDLSSYDDNEAWPCLFDDFVEFERDQMNQNITKEKEMENSVII